MSLNYVLKTKKFINIRLFELIKKFSNIGIIKKKDDYINLQEKKLLLHYLSSKNEL